ncbi:MAG: zf-HC2 domain-containing protein [Solirubrobacterales bacterium]|nr:zf-HC2 domain-containing protein [Solirubrobacterales bacterium]
MRQFMHRMRFRMDHRWAPDRMSAYLDGELEARPRSRMEHHLGECAECRRLIAGLTLVLDALHRLPTRGSSCDPVRIAASVRVRLAEPPA